MDRKRLFLVGVLLILLGIQFRLVESFVLNEPTTRALARMSRNNPVASTENNTQFMMRFHPHPTKKIAPPRWLGLALIAVGTVLSLQSFAMPKQG